MRNFLLVVHILSAAAWIGGGLFSWYAFTQLINGEEPARKSVRTLAAKADRYFGPAAGLTLLSGITLVLTVDAWGWTDTFVLIGLAVFLFSAIFQPLVSSKVEERLLTALDGDGDIKSAVAAFNRISVVDLGILLIALWAMVVKLGA